MLLPRQGKRVVVREFSRVVEAVQKLFNVILNEVKNLILSLNREILLSLRSIRMTVIKLFGQPHMLCEFSLRLTNVLT